MGIVLYQNSKLCQCSKPLPQIVVAAKIILSQQTFFFPYKTFAAMNICHDKHNFVVTTVLLQQSYFCHNKKLFCCDKHMFVVTKIILVAVPANDNQPCHHLLALKVHRFGGHSNTLYKAAVIRFKLHVTREQKVC